MVYINQYMVQKVLNSPMMRNWIKPATAALALLSSTPGAVTDAAKMKPCTQLRLAYAGEYDMAVSWNSFGEMDTVRVCWGTSETDLRSCADGSSTTYPTSTTYNNHVKLSPLEPDTTYFYHIEGDKANKVRNFKTAPKLGNSDEWSFAYVADLGTMGKWGLSDNGDDGDGWALKPGEETTVEALQSRLDEFEFVWHGGDIAYADYWLKEELNGYLPGNYSIHDGVELYEKILNLFYEQMAPVTGKKPYMVGPGNHEANCDDGGYGGFNSSICVEGQTNFTGYQNHYRMPNQESGGKLNMWYSFEHGNVHFVQINTETDLGKGIQGPDEPGGESGTNAGPFGSYVDEQIDWLKKDLKNVDRKKTPWVIVCGHRPWYAAVKTTSVVDDLKKAFEKVLYDNHVDLIFFGHVHNYERIDPTYKDKVDKNKMDNPRYPWYILNGAAGHYDGLNGIKKNHKPKGFAYGIDDTYGWSKLTVHNNTHLSHSFIASGEDKVLDTATLYKKHDF